MKNFFLFAGEASGDLHGSHLALALKNAMPGCTIEGVAGFRMREAGVDVVMPMERFEVMGFSDVLHVLPRLWKQFYQIRDVILSRLYDAVILIDYPGFNLRLAKALRKKGFKGKIVQFISPTVWVHGKKRIQHMESTLDLLLTIYPFEAAYFQETKLPVVYVGNPLQEYMRQALKESGWRSVVGLGVEKEYVALFPGSRMGEIERNLPLQLQAVKEVLDHDSKICVAISCVHLEAKKQIEALVVRELKENQHRVFIVPKEYTNQLMGECRSALAKSGTVTLELALREKPTVVTYALSRLNRFIAKYILRVSLPYYCIVNILGKKQVFPEFIESSFSAGQVGEKLLELHQEGIIRAQCLVDCQEIKKALGEHCSSQQAASAIGELVR